MSSIDRPRLYLDVDGVIVSDDSPFEQAWFNSIEKHAPEVVNRLGATGMELVWLSTWGDEARYLAEQINALRGGRVLRLDSSNRDDTSITRKLRALINDQDDSPRPFVWVDDMISPTERVEVENHLIVPKLLLSPDERIGLTEEELTDIEEFARLYRRASL